MATHAALAAVVTTPETVQPALESVIQYWDYDDEPSFAFGQSAALIVEEFNNRWQHRSSL